MRPVTQKLWRLMPVVVAVFCLICSIASANEALDTARKLYEEGKYSQAVKKAKEIIKANDNEVSAHRLLVRATYKLTGDLAHLVATYSAAVAKTPNSAVKHYILGYIYDYRNKPSSAMKEYGIARELDPTLPYVNYNIGYIHDTRGNHDAAIKYYTEETNNNPDYISSYFNLGKIRIKEKHYEDAIVFFKKMLELDPESVAAHDQLGACYYALNQIGDAMKHWKKTIRITPADEVEEANVYGLIYNAKGIYVKARHQFFRALKKDPNNPRFHNNLGKSYMDKGISKTFSPKKVKWLDEAISEFQKAIELDENYFEAMINLGEAYNLAGRQDESIETYKMALEKFPTNTIALKALGSAYEYIGYYKDAIKYYNQAIRLDKEDYIAMANLGNCYYKQGMKSSAVEQWDASLKVYPNQPKIRQLINTVFSKSK